MASIRIISFSCILIVFSLFSVNNLYSDHSTNEYVSKEGGYSIYFSDQWEVIQNVMGTDLIALSSNSDPADLFRENMNIIYSELEIPITPEEYYRFNIESLSELLIDFDLESSSDVTLNGVKARKITFTHTMGVVNARVIQYLILLGNRAFVMTFTSDPIDYQKVKPGFEKIAQSFQLNH